LQDYGEAYWWPYLPQYLRYHLPVTKVCVLEVQSVPLRYHQSLTENQQYPYQYPKVLLQPGGLNGLPCIAWRQGYRRQLNQSFLVHRPKDSAWTRAEPCVPLHSRPMSLRVG